jgi:3',5'-cyclic AMP phosphodiesterase CpdA
MKTIVHLSDLHFGRVDYKRIKPLVTLLQKIDPELIVISGDFTQRAKEEEFIEAKKFIEDLKKPLFVVPGNHDIPLYNIYRRFRSPFKKYLKFISSDLSPYYQDKDIAILGINSVRRFTISSGRISKKQIKEAESRLEKLDDKILKIIVCHHPFDLPIKKDTHHKHTHKVVARSKLVIKKFSKYKVDVFLSGHLHLQHVGDTTIRYKIKDFQSLIVQAGTAISIRRRGEPVSFNVLKLTKEKITVETFAGNHNESTYENIFTETFFKTSEGWRKNISQVN